MLDSTDDFSNSLSIDELRWLEASAIIDSPTRFSSGHESRQSLSWDDATPPLMFTNTASPENICPRPATPPPRRSTAHAPASSSEWIYRRPKTPPDSHRRASSRSPSLTRPSPHVRNGHDIPPSVSRSLSNSSTHTEIGSRDRQNESYINNSITPVWSTILRPRTRSERSVPLLQSTPPVNVASSPPPTFTSPFSTLARGTHTSPSRPVRVRPASIASTLSSASSTTSQSSSRLETPISPGFASPYSKLRRGYQRRYSTNPNSHPKLPPLSASCPSKSILTRTSSISTKDSATTTQKSVKFVEAPTVHYAAPSCWSIEALESIDPGVIGDRLDMGIDVDGMDMDMADASVSVHSERSMYSREDNLGPVHPRELQPSTPSPEKEKASGLRRFITLTRKAPAAPSSSTNPLLSTSVRPTISGPYALGTFPSLPQSLPTTRYTASVNRHKGTSQSSVSLRPAPSLESLRSAQSTTARSVRSVGSVRSTASTRGFRAWLGRIGNAWSES